MSAAELRTRVCFNKRLSLAEGARFYFAAEDSNRRRGPRLAGNGLLAVGSDEYSTYKSVTVNSQKYCFVRALQEAKAR